MRTLFRLPVGARNPVFLVGAALATAMAALFVVFVLLDLLGLLTNPYAGLLVFVAMPVLFVAGLLLIPFGAWLTARAVAARPTTRRNGRSSTCATPATATVAVGVLALTLVNIVIVSIAAYGGVHYMESAAFCGQVCHTTMEPQAVAHQAWPHARVWRAPSATSALAPARSSRPSWRARGSCSQVMTNRVPKPVPPPVGLDSGRRRRPASSATRRRRRHGDELRVLREYASDEANTEIDHDAAAARRADRVRPASIGTSAWTSSIRRADRHQGDDSGRARARIATGRPRVRPRATARDHRATGR